MPPLVVDTDGASDDAAALMIAASAADLTAVTVCGGVVDVDQAIHNVLVVLDRAGRPDVPVYRGAARSSTGAPFPPATDVHGEGGLGGHRYPAPGRAADPAPAADVLAEVLGVEGATVVTLGPLTNVAAALASPLHTEAPKARLVAMAGAQDAVGNVTAVAEYNVFCDPEAAGAVLAAGLDLTLVGWDVSRRDAVIGDAELRRLRELGTDRAQFLLEANEALAEFCRDVQGLAGYDLPDAAAVAVALEPGVVSSSARLPVAVETVGRLTRGMTVVDRRREAAAGPLATIVWSIDHGRFLDLLVSSLRG